jgi:hypothetical protein
MNLGPLLVAAVAAALTASCAAYSPGRDDLDQQQRHVIVRLPTDLAPRPSDVSSPEAVVLALYETISGPAERERERDWARLRTLVSPDATFRLVRWFYPDQVVEELRRWSAEKFIEAGKLFWHDSGFWEREVWSRTEHFGNVAHVLSAYEGRVGSPESEPVTRGVNSFQLVRAGDRWWLVSTVWDIETADNRVPMTESGTPDT